MVPNEDTVGYRTDVATEVPTEDTGSMPRGNVEGSEDRVETEAPEEDTVGDRTVICGIETIGSYSTHFNSSVGRYSGMGKI